MSDDDATAEPDKISSSQMRGMHALLRDHGISGDKAVHAYLDTWLAERGLDTIESRTDLPYRVAAAVIRDLEDKAVLHAPGGLTRALIEIQKDLPVVAKTQTAEVAMRGGGTYSYSYATLGDVTDAAMPLLRAHGIAWVCIPRQSGTGGYELAGTLLHISGEKLEGCLPLHGNDPQVIGGAVTYFRRYLLGSMLGIITDTDPDARATRGGAPATQSWDGPATLELLARIDTDGQALGLTYAEVMAQFIERRKITLDQADTLDPWEVKPYADHIAGLAEAARTLAADEAARAAAYDGEQDTKVILDDLDDLRQKHAPDTSMLVFSEKFRTERAKRLGRPEPLTLVDLEQQPAWSIAEWRDSVRTWIEKNAADAAAAQS